jgi:hypothetical protein
MNQTILKSIRRSRFAKGSAIFMVTQMIFATIAPTRIMALTSGPSQPEAESFTSVETTDMVNPFTGDLSYNIPLMEIGGYPINLSYQSGITMDQEATWAGLGWNVNVGAITRQMRGIPDEFWGEEITKEINMKDNLTVGANVGISGEIFGFDLGALGAGNVSFGLDVNYNNYKGFNVKSSLTPSLGSKSGATFPTNFSLGMSSSLDGMNINPNLSFSANIKGKNDKETTAGIGFGLNMNSRTGLSSLTLKPEYSTKKTFDGGASNKQLLNSQVSSSVAGKIMSFFGGSISLGCPTYTPQIDLPFETGAFTGTFKLGADAWGGDFDLKLGGYGSLQRLKQKVIKTPAYGYFYSQKANGKDNAIMDFNREKDGSFTEFTPALPLTSFTHDAFSINAHGLSGSFRGFRNDLGFVHDNRMQTDNFDLTVGVEMNAASVLDIGFDVAANMVHSESKAWRDDNPAEPYLQFKENNINDPKENFHLKITGELNTISDPSFETKTGGNKATMIPFTTGNTTFATTLQSKLKHNSGPEHNLTGQENRTEREQRNVAVTYLTVKDVKNGSPRRLQYISPLAQDHHIAEITVVHPDGKRYVFGLAAYNKTQKEVTFNVGAGKFGEPGLVAAGEQNNPNLVENISGLANRNNNKGIDHYFDATTTPAYAHTWFLTEVYSPDYVDVTGNGPSKDDLGNYVVFNYGNKTSDGKITPDIPEYKWRTPTEANKATYNKGLVSDPTDDKASYIYGIKELYYLHTIESKNQIAVFALKERQDGLGVTSEFGGPGGPKQKAIEKISLYSIEDYTTGNGIAIKTVHFDHKYTLCHGIKNSANGEGKLTLTKVWFTHLNSSRSQFSHYSFDYSTNNPNYAYRSTDRWGNHKPFGGNLGNTPDNSEFPYVEQNTDTQKGVLQSNSEAWALKRIGLPTGGTIEINYEPDDYAYVQDRKAARMFKVLGTWNDKTNGYLTNDRLFKKGIGGGNSGVTNYNYLFFELEEGTEGLSNGEIRQAYLPKTFTQSTPYLYYRFFVNMNNGLEYDLNINGMNEKCEYVSGYAEVDIADPDCIGRLPSSNVGYIKLKPVYASDRPNSPGNAIAVNPISKAAWQFSRINTPRYAFNQPDPDDTAFEQIVKLLAGADLVGQMIQMFKGPNVAMLEKGFGAYFKKERSWIRLNDPDGQKLGGGSRVKSITISDNWEDMESSEASASYTKEFEYKLPDGRSSGVAAYEPMIGADENPMREPVFYPGKKNLLIPGDGFYQETPYGESFFPAPTIGYSRVVTKDKRIAGSSNSGTGFMVDEFYTAKDYPTITTKTVIDPKRKKTSPALALLKINVKDYMRVSQGFAIEVNDMHGKPKSKKIYSETDTEDESHLISSQAYTYFDQPYDEETRILDNNIPVIGEKGEISTKMAATEYDIVADLRQQKTTVKNVTVAGNLAYFQAGPIPILLPTVFPGFSSEITLFRSAVVTKVIYKYGILKETTATDLGSSITTQNKAFDPLTGTPLLVQINSEFEDEQYKISLPARWAYDGMGPAYKNVGFEFTGNTNIDATGKVISASQADILLRPGDELISYKVVTRGQTPNVGNEYTYRYWVASDASGKYLIDAYGKKINITANSSRMFKVIRSGRRNINSATMSEITSLQKPTNAGETLLEFNAGKKILAANASNYDEQWAVNALNTERVCITTCELDPFAMAIIQLLNRAIQEGTILSGIPIPISEYASLETAETLNLNSCPNATITLSPPIASDGLDISLVSNSENCSFPCRIITIRGESQNRPTNYRIVTEPPVEEEPDGDYPAYISPTTYSTSKGDCNENTTTTAGDVGITITMRNGQQEKLILSAHGACFSRTCRTEWVDCIKKDVTVNPYISGHLGNWRPSRSHAFITSRVNQSLTTAADVRGGGYFAQFHPYWIIPASPSANWTETTYNTPAEHFWQWVAEMTNYGTSGADVENRNALPAYSSALYGYHNLLATAIANNARYREIAYDGFEDYFLQYNTAECFKDHFRFENHIAAVSSEESHSGNYAIKVPVGNTLSLERDLLPDYVKRTTRNVPYVIQAGDLLGQFSPPAGKNDYKMVLSFWAKPAGDFPTEFYYTGISPKITVGSTVLNPIENWTSKKVEGWQKFEYVYEFDVPATGTIKVELENARSQAVFYDDLRIHPFHSNMKSYVYDVRTLRLMAELDENNFATFYEYDEDGGLVRTKKETERGVVTLQENRKNNYKKDL